MFAHDLGIRPWETGELTVQEFNLLADWVEHHNRAQEDQG